jgi:2-keto-4-pentenoate hydratase/2-oxohepta-3-ene-1,7-dioic acid hydratase in catechol pathway
MRLCRYQHNGHAEVAIYEDQRIISLNRLAQELMIELPTAMSGNILDYLPPDGKSAAAAEKVYERFKKLPAADQARLSRPMAEARLRVPVPNPSKVILLAGNYNEHIREGGGLAVAREETFPYFFWKPPSTTLTNPNDPVKIPAVSPNHVDWELELGVFIGKSCHNVSEKDALKYVAGYTVCNDISDRKFQINPKRKERPNDKFFDWLHGKWHDTFLPVGPCVTSASSIPDPQKLAMKLKVNGQVMQDSNTNAMIFPVAALVSILSSFVTLEPGDLVVTGTPSGVGNARKPPVYLKAGDIMEAEIAEIGMLRNPVV